MGRVYPTNDPAESLFDYRVASDANKKLALGAKQWSMRRRPFFLGVGFHHPHTKWRIPQKTWRDYETRRIAMPEITRKTQGAPFYAFGDNNIAPTAITIDGTPIRGSPFTTSVAPGATCAGASKLSGAGRDGAVAGGRAMMLLRANRKLKRLAWRASALPGVSLSMTTLRLQV